MAAILAARLEGWTGGPSGGQAGGARRRLREQEPAEIPLREAQAHHMASIKRCRRRGRMDLRDRGWNARHRSSSQKFAERRSGDDRCHSGCVGRERGGSTAGRRREPLLEAPQAQDLLSNWSLELGEIPQQASSNCHQDFSSIVFTHPQARKFCIRNRIF